MCIRIRELIEFDSLNPKLPNRQIKNTFNISTYTVDIILFIVSCFKQTSCFINYDFTVYTMPFCLIKHVPEPSSLWVKILHF